MKKTITRILALVAIALTAACTQIDTGNVGVERTLGQVKPEPLPPGLYFTLFKSVDEVIAKEVPVEINDLRPQTSDKITLTDLDIDVYVQIDPSKAALVATKWPGDMTQVEKAGEYALGLNYITRQAREAIYTAASKYGSATIHTERTALSAEVVRLLQASLNADAGKGLFTVRSVNVRNLVTDPALEKNIKEAANAQFKLQAERNQLEVAKVEADRKRVEAQGEADSTRIKAQAVSVNGGAEYVQLKAIERWDGKLPTTTAGGSIPFIKVDAKQ